MKAFLLFLLFSYVISEVMGGLSLIPESESRDPIEGRICAYSDFNKDRYTDLLIQRNDRLLILLQTEAGSFDEKKGVWIQLSDSDPVYCSVGDFNGDAAIDIMVTKVCDNVNKC